MYAVVELVLGFFQATEKIPVNPAIIEIFQPWVLYKRNVYWEVFMKVFTFHGFGFKVISLVLDTSYCQKFDYYGYLTPHQKLGE